SARWGRELTGAREDRVECLLGEAARVGVLPARVVRAEERYARPGGRPKRTVPESRAGARAGALRHEARARQSVERALPGKRPEREHDAERRGEGTYLAVEVAGARATLLGRRQVVGRRAAAERP